MKKILFVIFSLIVLESFVFAEEFEGVLGVEFNSKIMTNSAQIFIKGQKMKMMPQKQISETNNGYPIIDFSNKKGIFVSLTDKYYMELPLDTMIKNLEQDPITLREEGNGKYLDFNVIKYTYSDNEYKVEIWGTRDIIPGIDFLVGMQRIGGEGLVLAKANHYLYKNGIFPLKGIVSDSKGNVLISIQVSSVSKQRVADKEFEIPYGYRKFSDVMKEKMKKSR
ncbi:MAG: DUF4412 domain-containing protein [Brevinematia bacterium]